MSAGGSARVDAQVACVVAGPPGSGKSTFGRALASRLSAVLLDLDPATNPLMAEIGALVGAGADLDHPGLSGRIRDARYRCLIGVAVDNIRLGRSAVLVAPFTTEIHSASAWSALAASVAPARPWLIWVRVPPVVAARRRRERGLPRDMAADLEQLREDPPPAVEHLVVDGAAEAGSQARRIAERIGTG